MKLFKSTKAVVTHPVTLFIIAMVLGMVLAYLWARQIIAIPSPFCAK